MCRPYLVGNPFYAWVDHKPLGPLFNHKNRLASVRITKLKNQVGDLNFMVKHILGKQIPVDFMF